MQQEFENINNCLIKIKCKITAFTNKLEETLLEIGGLINKRKRKLYITVDDKAI